MTVTPQPFAGSQLDRWEVYAAVVLLAGGGAMTVQRCRLETGYGGAVSCLPLPLLPLSFATQNLLEYGSATRNFASRVWGVGLARANNIIIAERCPR